MEIAATSLHDPFVNDFPFRYFKLTFFYDSRSELASLSIKLRTTDTRTNSYKHAQNLLVLLYFEVIINQV